jgi:hypothetical protein
VNLGFESGAVLLNLLVSDLLVQCLRL